jgi:hypothetical protein
VIRFLAHCLRLVLVLSAVASSGSPGRADIIWSESVNGDLSNNQALPTAVSLALGANSVIGTVGGGDVQDWITIHIPQGLALSSVILRSYVSTDQQGFTGFQKGTAFVGSPFVASSYAGFAHFGTGATNGQLPIANLVGADLLPIMANPAAAPGSKGFTLPLGPGDFTFLIQQTGSATTAYQFDFVAVAVPEPYSSVCLLGVLCAVGLVLRVNRLPRRIA